MVFTLSGLMGCTAKMQTAEPYQKNLSAESRTEYNGLLGYAQMLKDQNSIEDTKRCQKALNKVKRDIEATEALKEEIKQACR